MSGEGEEWRVKVSKRLAGLLRHYGPDRGVRIDREGWADIGEVARALQRMGLEVSEDDIVAIARSDPKGRYEVQGHKIRARYGHSLPVEIQYEPLDNPPPLLYHGTPTRNLASIMSRGLLPGRRRFVHLTMNPSLAIETGKRHGRPVALLAVDTSCLRRLGVPLYRATSHIVLAPRVPPECLRIELIEG